MPIRKIKSDIYSVGAIDWDRKLFDKLIPLPDGTSYNAYLIKGNDKVALIDTVYPPKLNDLLENLNNLEINKIDYIISNHAEQDHSGSLPKLLEIYPEAKIVTNPKCQELLKDMLLIQDEKFIVIKDGEVLSLGDKTLEFIFAPWVHWPDTMFTYLREDKILFTCDFFGSHLATSNLFVQDNSEVYEPAKRYYAEIMMPFRVHIKKHLDKLTNFDIEMIAPSHGPIYKDTQFIYNCYKKWSSDNVKKEVIIPYISMYESTSKMVSYLIDKLIEKDISVKPFDLTDGDIGKLAINLVDASTIVLGTPIVLGGLHPDIIYTAYLANALRPKLKYASIIGSYGWSASLADKAVEQIKSLLPGLKIELLSPVFSKGHPKKENFEELDKLVDEIVARNQ